METKDWAAASSGGSSDSDVNSPDSDNEDRFYASGDLPKLQFRKDPSKARWKEELGMAEIVNSKGRMLTTTGISRGGKIYIFLEDALFLAEIGALHLLDDENKCIPLENIYKKFAEGVGGSSWESFEVYRHLKSLGYIIKRHGVCWSRKRGKNVPASVEGDSGSQTITENGNEDIDSIAEISELFSTMKINELRPKERYGPVSFAINLLKLNGLVNDPVFAFCGHVPRDGNPNLIMKHSRQEKGKNEDLEIISFVCIRCHQVIDALHHQWSQYHVLESSQIMQR
ncbi:tRNA-splicing endonuclease, subunit Sen54 [Artemisia annua]|uniref:tRNA-splicing endonuclease, subunit Sen54 n=1 Tax=Artemisia annua TaxID=35608 RepID=A0A2U1LSG1_ARTAN|nr:tRNA-splicing endonuclease, subunit Sen54 [Artemisia annua]